MRKKVLLLSDFSKDSWQAITYAASLLEKVPCDFFVLNAYRTEHFGTRGAYVLDPEGAFNELAKRNSLKGLGHILTKATFELDNPLHQFRTLARPGPLLEALQGLVGELGIEMIVLGARGIHSCRGSRFGSKVHKVLGSSLNCPVLVVPLDARPITRRDILMVLRHKTRDDASQLGLLAEIAAAHDAHLHIYKPEAKGFFKAAVKRRQVILRRRLSGVKHCFLSHKDRPLVCGTSEKEPQNRWALVSYLVRLPGFLSYFGWGPSLRKQIVNFAPCPLLVLYE